MKFKVPASVRNDAILGMKMRNKGFAGGTETGWKRGEQLSNSSYIGIEDLANMRTWFARHGPDAKNGGTSYVGYCKWISEKMPMDKNFAKYRGAVSWLLWGGDAAYKWLKEKKIMSALETEFVNRKKASSKNNLKCKKK